MTVTAPTSLKTAAAPRAEKPKGRLLLQSALIIGAALSAFAVTYFH
jgi:hypothetical protein